MPREGAPPPAGHQADPDAEPPAASREDWDAQPEAVRSEILAAVKAANPGLAPFPKLLLPLCLVELAARPPAPPPIPDHGREAPRGPAGPAAEPGPGLPDSAHPLPRVDVIPFAGPGISPRIRKEPGGRTSTRYG